MTSDILGPVACLARCGGVFQFSQLHFVTIISRASLSFRGCLFICSRNLAYSPYPDMSHTGTEHGSGTPLSQLNLLEVSYLRPEFGGTEAVRVHRSQNRDAFLQTGVISGTFMPIVGLWGAFMQSWSHGVCLCQQWCQGVHLY